MSIETNDLAGDVLAEFVAEAKTRLAARREVARADDERRRQERDAHEKAVADLTSRRDEMKGEIEALRIERNALADSGVRDIAFRAALAGLALAHISGCRTSRGFQFSIHDERLASQYLCAAGWREWSVNNWGPQPGGNATLREAFKRQIIADLAGASGLLEAQRQAGSALAGRALPSIRVEPFS